MNASHDIMSECPITRLPSNIKLSDTHIHEHLVPEDVLEDITKKSLKNFLLDYGDCMQ